MKTETLFPINFSSSMLEDLWGCPLAFFRRYCQKISFNGGNNNPDLIAGGLIAGGLEITRKAFFNEKLPAKTAIEIGKIYILEGQNTGHPTKTNEKLAEVFEFYFKRFPLDSGLTPVELIDNKFGIEYKFEFDLGIEHPDLPDRNLIFTGKLDFLGEKWYNGKNRRFVVDDKTCSGITKIPGTNEPDIEREKEEYQLRGQFNAYLWAIKILEESWKLKIDCHGVIVRRIPILKEMQPAFEIPIEISNFQVETWRRATIHRIEEFIERYKAFKKENDFRKFFPPVFGTVCTKWGKPVTHKMGVNHNFNYSCPYAIGCMIKNGDDILLTNSIQEVGYPEVPLERGRISLKQYLNEIKS